jgi:membrane protein
VIGQDAAQNALTAQLSGLMGQQTAEVLQTAVASASSTSSGVIATTIGVITLIVTASGVFGEMQTALNAIWKAEPKGTTAARGDRLPRLTVKAGRRAGCEVWSGAKAGRLRRCPSE